MQANVIRTVNARAGFRATLIAVVLILSLPSSRWEFVEGDAEDLPFEGASFDVVISMFGSMSAPNQERVLGPDAP